ncbi:glycoside hydrolase family 28 protein [Bifidobacterium avesanii]|nr:glycoside hydrolase family 28 protein [Bifidobacterium avesanii]KAB8288912.1 glycoside hydrolase family protein [Bifidobacterium avesanii]
MSNIAADVHSAILAIREPDIPSREVSISRYPTIQEAVDYCAQRGGGRVTVPEGHWLSGPIHLRSNVELHVEAGATIEFSPKPADYLPAVFTRWEGTECWNYSPLVYARDCHDVALTGSGTLMGNGMEWWDWKQAQKAGSQRLYDLAVAGTPVDERVFGTEQDALRPSFVQFVNCRNALVEGVTLEEGPMWTIHPVYCEDLIVRGVRINSIGPNTDGCNPDSCRNVLIEGCRFNTGDDCIAIDAGLNEDGWRVNRPCENVEISHCTMLGGHGGISIGSMVSGGVRNVYAHDCSLVAVERGIRIKSMRGRGGYVEDALFENLTIKAVKYEAVSFNMFYPSSTVEPKNAAPSALRRVTLRHVTGSGAATALEFRGLPEEPLRGIALDSVYLTAGEAIRSSDVVDLTMRDVQLAAEA